jgi:hypothetical protein
MEERELSKNIRGLATIVQALFSAKTCLDETYGNYHHNQLLVQFQLNQRRNQNQKVTVEEHMKAYMQLNCPFIPGKGITYLEYPLYD